MFISLLKICFQTFSCSSKVFILSSFFFFLLSLFTLWCRLQILPDIYCFFFFTLCPDVFLISVVFTIKFIICFDILDILQIFNCSRLRGHIVCFFVVNPFQGNFFLPCLFLLSNILVYVAHLFLLFIQKSSFRLSGRFPFLFAHLGSSTHW